MRASITRRALSKSKASSSVFSFKNRVQEPLLIEVVHRLGFVNAGDAPDVHAGFRKQTKRLKEVGCAFADVCAECDVHGDHRMISECAFCIYKETYFMPARRRRMPSMAWASGSFKRVDTPKKRMP